jgi:selenide, water dikinase
MGPETLAQVLRPLRELFRPEAYPDLLVGLEVADDAAVYRLTDDLAIIHTLDFFPPVVDDPYDYGAIAAANAMSDIYAMGGEVILALSIAAFPPGMPPDITAEILRGGGEKVKEAGAILAGGHTIDDEEPKYGLAVLGSIHPDRILTKGGGQPGDILVLTKPLGVGIVTTAAKADVDQPGDLDEAVASMAQLNRTAVRILQAIGVNACTDVTGFALLGHASEMAEKGGVQLAFSFAKLPFVSGAQAYAEDWLFPAGTCHNDDFYSQMVQFDASISEEMQQLLYTPETSGGLLAAVAPERLPALQEACDAAGQKLWQVGVVREGEGVDVEP